MDMLVGCWLKHLNYWYNIYLFYVCSIFHFLSMCVCVCCVCIHFLTFCFYHCGEKEIESRKRELRVYMVLNMLKKTNKCFITIFARPIQFDEREAMSMSLFCVAFMILSIDVFFSMSFFSSLLFFFLTDN